MSLLEPVPESVKLQFPGLVQLSRILASFPKYIGFRGSPNFRTITAIIVTYLPARNNLKHSMVEHQLAATQLFIYSPIHRLSV